MTTIDPDSKISLPLLEATPHPIDVSALKRGDLITEEQVEEAIRVRVDDRLFRIKLQGLKERIVEELQDLRSDGTVVLRSLTYLDATAVPRIGLSVLTVEEAMKFLAQRGETGFGQYVANHARSVGLNVESLSDDLQRQHTQNVNRSGAMLTAALAARKKQAEIEAAEKNSRIG